MIHNPLKQLLRTGQYLKENLGLTNEIISSINIYEDPSLFNEQDVFCKREGNFPSDITFNGGQSKFLQKITRRIMFSLVRILKHTTGKY